MTSISIESKKIISDDLRHSMIPADAEAHNAIYRGKDLGTAVTEEQYAQISAGTFDDLYIGDYWRINERCYRIADFDYWYNTGDINCTTHHAVIVPEAIMYNAQMHNTASGQYDQDDNPTTGAYIGSDMGGRDGGGVPTGNLLTAYNMLVTDFGKPHLLVHREYLANAAEDGYETSMAWYGSVVELMNEEMVYGCVQSGNRTQEMNAAQPHTIDTSQLALFGFRHDLRGIGPFWWLRDVASPTFFSCVRGRGQASAYNSSCRLGVRPVFGIY